MLSFEKDHLSYWPARLVHVSMVIGSSKGPTECLAIGLLETTEYLWVLVCLKMIVLDNDTLKRTSSVWLLVCDYGPKECQWIFTCRNVWSLID